MSQLETLNDMENVLVRLIRYAHYFELSTGHEGGFWPIVQNAVGEAACLFWCHLFGSRKEDLHFSKFFDDPSNPDFSESAVKARMLLALGLSENEYTEFWKTVKDCRDKYVSHKELGATVVFPDLALCRIQAEELRRILAEFARWKSDSTSDHDWAFWADYFAGQSLRQGQFRELCESEFKNGVTSVASAISS